jgi:hypothetical protein
MKMMTIGMTMKTALLQPVPLLSEAHLARHLHQHPRQALAHLLEPRAVLQRVDPLGEVLREAPPPPKRLQAHHAVAKYRAKVLFLKHQLLKKRKRMVQRGFAKHELRLI